MHAEIAHESGRFDINGVLKDVTEKLIRRHPHVFGNSDARDSGAVLKQWESIKRAEKTHKHGRTAGNAGGHYLDDLPSAAPCPGARAKNAVEGCPRQFRLDRSTRRDRKG
jgi:ATP diphosphatase